MLSVIIPVYNTEKYLDKCLRSILDQDYKDYEIIAVNDGSTDGSLDILKQYANKDSRVRVIDKINEGQGVARNIAIKEANGEYICCIDSDDWIMPGSFSYMIERQQSTGADIVIGNSAVTVLDSEEIRMNNTEKVSGIVEDEALRENIFNITPTVWPKIIKRSLFTDNKIEFPRIFFEDLAIMPLIYALANRIAFVNRCIYIQRVNSDSTVHRIEGIYDRIKFVEYLVSGFRTQGIYGDYKFLIDEYLLKRAQINLRVVKRLTNKWYTDFSSEQQRVWKENYGLDTLSKRKVYCFGSYNLMILAKIFMRLEDSAMVDDYFGGSSMISCMSTNNSELNKLNVCHPNLFRENIIGNDFERTFMHMNPGRFYENEFFFVDLLEERYDIGVYKGEYFTISQAFEDIKIKLDIDYDIIRAFSEEWLHLWKFACNRFVDRLRLIVGDKTIVLVKSFLSEKYYGDSGDMFFDEIDSIKACNEQLSKCYEYFESKCPQAKVIEIRNDENYKTDVNFRHGCYPWHLSDFAYGKFARIIEERLYK